MSNAIDDAHSTQPFPPTRRCPRSSVIPHIEHLDLLNGLIAAALRKQLKFRRTAKAATVRPKCHWHWLQPHFFLLSHSLLSPCLLVFIAQKRESQFKYSNLLHSLAALFRDDFLAKFHLALPESYVMDDEFVEQCFCSHATFDCQHTAQV